MPMVNQILHTFDYRPLQARGMRTKSMGRIRSGTDTGFQLFSNVIPSTAVSSSEIRRNSLSFVKIHSRLYRAVNHSGLTRLLLNT